MPLSAVNIKSPLSRNGSGAGMSGTNASGFHHSPHRSRSSGHHPHHTTLRARAVSSRLLCGMLMILSCWYSYTLLWRFYLAGWNIPDIEVDSRGQTRIRRRPDRLYKYDLQGQRIPTEPFDAILEGYLTLIDIDVPETGLVSSDEQLYSNVGATFCHLSWERQARNPSQVPMFRDLIAQSPLCRATMYTTDDLWTLTQRAKQYDSNQTLQFPATPRHAQQPASTPPNLVVFHETRCGSTLVANLLAAAFGTSVSEASTSETSATATARVYSEAPPPVQALLACDDTPCDETVQSALIRDVFYWLGRESRSTTSSSAPRYRFYKLQSVGVQAIRRFRRALPTTPWMFVYRDSVEILMSHFKHEYLVTSTARQYDTGPRPPPKRPVCLRNYQESVQPAALVDAVRHVRPDQSVDDLSQEEYCAAHLAGLAVSAIREYEYQKNESAVATLSSSSSLSLPPTWFVNYHQLPHVLWETVLPRLLGTTQLSPHAVESMTNMALVYSKDRAATTTVSSLFGPSKKAASTKWQDDSAIKRHKAPEVVKAATRTYLDPYYDKLELIRKEIEESKQ